MEDQVPCRLYRCCLMKIDDGWNRANVFKAGLTDPALKYSRYTGQESRTVQAKRYLCSRRGNNTKGNAVAAVVAWWLSERGQVATFNSRDNHVLCLHHYFVKFPWNFYFFVFFLPYHLLCEGEKGGNGGILLTEIPSYLCIIDDLMREGGLERYAKFSWCFVSII